MKRIFRVFLTLFLITSGAEQIVLAQAGPAWAWAVNNKQISIDAAGLVTDSAGNVYTAGSRLSKHSPSGVLLWSRNLMDTSQYVLTRGLACDAAGNLYLAGYFGGTIQFDSITLTTYGRDDIFIAKYNSNGQVQWARHAGGPGPPPGSPPDPSAIYDAVWAIAADSSGNCYLTGICEPNAQFDTITANLTNTNRFVAKYDTQGYIQWLRSIANEAYGIAVDQLGSYYLTGRYSTFTSAGVFIEKYNANGSLVWSKQGNGSGFKYATSVAADSFGNCFITGVTYDTTVFDNFTVTPPLNKSSMFLVKYDSLGVVQWGKQTTGSGCGGEVVVTDAQGNAYVTGGMTGTVSFSGAVQLNGINNGWQDVYAAKYSPNGNLDWALQAGSGGSDHGQAIGALPNGDVYVAGSHQTGCTFGNINLAGSQAYNFFVAKISANPLSIAENNAASKFDLYPNPATSEVKISIKNFPQGILIVYNLTGQKMYEAVLQPEMKIQVENWPAGIYAVKLTSGNKMFTQKLIVTR